MTADLTVVVVADDASQRRRTMDALAVQSDAPALLCETTWAELASAVDAVSSTWVAILPDGAEPSPVWISLLDSHLSSPGMGCVGGRVLRLNGPEVNPQWFGGEPNLAKIDWLGRIRSKFCDIPDTPRVSPATFLRLEGIAMRTRDVLPQALESIEHWTGFEMAACFRAREMGTAVLFDSELIVCATTGHGPQTPAPEDVHAWFNYGCGEIQILRHYPRRAVAVWLTVGSLLLGSRVSPGALLWPLYLTKSSRRSRWRAIMRGKVRGAWGNQR